MTFAAADMGYSLMTETNPQRRNIKLPDDRGAYTEIAGALWIAWPR